MKGGGKLSINPHLVVSWFRWCGRVQDRSNTPKPLVKMGWKYLAEPSYGSTKAAVQIYVFNVVGVCHDGNLLIPWWTSVVNSASRLKK